MKKSLILSIVMTLVLVVSMSTATYAWYTSNSTVTTTATTIGTATAADANLEFTWQDAANNYVYNGTEIAFTGIASGSTGISPMVPTVKPTGETTPAQFTFISSTMDATGSTFTGAGATVTPWSQTYTGTGTGETYNVLNGEAAPDNWATTYTMYYTKNGDAYSRVQYSTDGAPSYAANTYYTRTGASSDTYGINGTVTTLKIRNNAQTTTENIVITPTITNVSGTTLANAMRIAVFAGGTYKGTLANAASAVVNYAASWTAGASIETTLSATDYTATTTVDIGTIGAAAETPIVLYVWYDGQMLGNANAGSSASFALNFTASAAVGG